MRITDEYVFFWDGPFSQWYPSQFTVGAYTYNCAEQFMMHSKAVLFQDHKTADKIMKTDSPREQKKLGRQVVGWNDDIWLLFREGVVLTGSLAKFSQNAQLREALLFTEDRVLVEASPYDKVWGIGLPEEDDNCLDPKKWKGLNLLGKILTRTKFILRNE